MSPTFLAACLVPAWTVRLVDSVAPLTAATALFFTAIAFSWASSLIALVLVTTFLKRSSWYVANAIVAIAPKRAPPTRPSAKDGPCTPQLILVSSLSFIWFSYCFYAPRRVELGVRRQIGSPGPAAVSRAGTPARRTGLCRPEPAGTSRCSWLGGALRRPPF